MYRNCGIVCTLKRSEKFVIIEWLKYENFPTDTNGTKI